MKFYSIIRRDCLTRCYSFGFALLTRPMRIICHDAPNDPRTGPEITSPMINIGKVKKTRIRANNLWEEIRLATEIAIETVSFLMYIGYYMYMSLLYYF